MHSKLVAFLACGWMATMACYACDSVRVSRENGSIVILHHPDTFDTRGAWNHFRSIASTNGPVHRFLLVIGEDSKDVEGCARLIRAAGFTKVQTTLVPANPQVPNWGMIRPIPAAPWSTSNRQPSNDTKPL